MIQPSADSLTTRQDYPLNSLDSKLGMGGVGVSHLQNNSEDEASEERHSQSEGLGLSGSSRGVLVDGGNREPEHGGHGEGDHKASPDAAGSSLGGEEATYGSTEDGGSAKASSDTDDAATVH